MSTLRERWKHQADFIADVLRFGLWATRYPGANQEEMTDARIEILTGADPVAGIHRLCYWHVSRLLTTPMFRLGLIAAAHAEGDDVIRDAISGRHLPTGLLWRDFFNDVLRCRGLVLRPGITVDDCVNLLAAVGDGLVLRALADPAARLVDENRRRSLLGTAALALVAGCVERADTRTGTPLEQAVRAMLRDLS